MNCYIILDNEEIDSKKEKNIYIAQEKEEFSSLNKFFEIEIEIFRIKSRLY